MKKISLSLEELGNGYLLVLKNEKSETLEVGTTRFDEKYEAAVVVNHLIKFLKYFGIEVEYKN